MEEKLEKYKINQDVWLNFWERSIVARVIAVKECLDGRYKYDLSANGINGKRVRLYGVDYEAVSAIHPNHTKTGEADRSIVGFSYEEIVKCWHESNITATSENGFKDVEAFIQSLGKNDLS